MSRTHLSGLSLRDLEYAVAVDEFRHFGRAAEHCGVSQPALSEQLRKLEALLGAPLFERAARRVQVTPQGEILLRHARIVLREALDLLEIAHAQSNPLDGPLRLGVIPTLGPYYLPLILRPLRQHFPGLELRLQEGRTQELTEALGRGGLDTILAAAPWSSDALVSEPLFFEPFQVLLPTGHHLAGGQDGRSQPEPVPGAPTRKAPALKMGALQPSQLPADDLLLLEEGHCLRDQALSLCHLPEPGPGRISAGQAGRGTRHASSLEMLRHMVAAGEGYSLIPRLANGMAGDAAGLGALVRIRDLAADEAGVPAGRVIALAWRSTDPRREHFTRLAHFLRDTAPDGTHPVPSAAPVAPSVVGEPSGIRHKLRARSPG